MKITGVRAVLTAPEGIALVVVRVDTDQPGLYGLGCATFTQRATLVAGAVEDYLAPLLVGRDPGNIEDLWHLMYVRLVLAQRPDPEQRDLRRRHGAVGHQGQGRRHAASTTCSAGKCREAAMVYRHADGREPAEVLDDVLAYREAGSLARPLPDGRLRRRGSGRSPIAEALRPAPIYDPRRVRARATRRAVRPRARSPSAPSPAAPRRPRAAASRSTRSGWPRQLEPYRPVLPRGRVAARPARLVPADPRGQSTTPLAMGELFNQPRRVAAR